MPYDQFHQVLKVLMRMQSPLFPCVTAKRLVIQTSKPLLRRWTIRRGYRHRIGKSDKK